MENLTKALIRFQMEVGKISKESKNPYFNSKYASLPQILDVIRAPLITCGLAVIQMPHGDGDLRTILAHESGEIIESTFSMKLVKNDPQALGSAITYARRYAIGAILNLNIDDDDDANSAMPAPQAPQKPKSAPQATTTELPWFNATNKDGSLTDDAIKVCGAFMSGKRTWESFYTKYKLSKKGKEAMVAYIEAKIIEGIKSNVA
jgi:hypothetical protein